jgi:NAD(P)-dependent dehydrogenase (short-subunit alcohol dehydrogenase family)
MDELAGKVAVVTGAGSGIGLGLARTFAQAGMAVALLDVRGETLPAAVEQVRAFGARAFALTVDVSDRAALSAAADAIERELGKIHVFCNNAGVLVFGKPILEIGFDEWDWIVRTNLVGTINGVEIFVPRMLAHGEPGHVVNTASIGGFQVRAEMRTGAYATVKYGVVALSEALAGDLAGTNVGVSILAPAAVNTGIYRSPEQTPEELKAGMSPDLVGRRVLAAIRANELYVFTHVATKAWLERRHQRIIDAFDATERWARAEGLLANAWVAGGRGD